MATVTRFMAVMMGLMLSGLWACGDGGRPFSGDVRGKVQKGPFINGAEVSVNELGAGMGQTGRVFASTIADDTGAFRVSGVELANSVARVRATGYYFDETARAISDAPLSLVTFVDFADRASANLNVFGHLQSSRIEYLVQEQGMSFGAARTQAHAEVLAVFGFTAASESSADELDITAGGDDNAMLLTASIILQSTRSVGQLSELLSAIQTDLRTDGTLDSSASQTALMNGAWAANPARIREGLVARFDALGVSGTVPAFETYLQSFIEEMPYPYTGAITYPADAERPNILELDRTEFPRGAYVSGKSPFQFIAEIPPNTQLKIRMTRMSPMLWGFYPDEGFEYRNEVVDDDNFVQSWTARTTGRVSMGISLDWCEGCEEGAALLEYFEYGRTEPTRVKTIRWGSAYGAPAPCSLNPCGNAPLRVCNADKTGLMAPQLSVAICTDETGTASCDFGIEEILCEAGEVCDTCRLEPGRQPEACCYKPGGEGDSCYMIPLMPGSGSYQPADTCSAGLYCWDGQPCPGGDACCVPAGGDSQPCFLDSTCNEGLICSGYCPPWGQCCLPLGGDGDPCETGVGRLCADDLVCAEWADCALGAACCRAAGGPGERCLLNRECNDGLTCSLCPGAEDDYCCYTSAED